MSDAAPSIVSFDAPVGRPEILSPQLIDRVLDDFRAWLELIPRADYEPRPSGSAGENGDASALRSESSALPSSVDLATLVGQFIALRQEVNLQTRASRGQMEQSGTALKQSDEALGELKQVLETLEQQQESSEDREQKIRDETQRPLLKSLIDGRDALALAQREVQRVQENLQPLLDQLCSSVVAGVSGSLPATEPAPQAAFRDDATLPDVNIRLPWWAMLFGAGRSLEEKLARVRSWCERQRGHAIRQQRELAEQQRTVRETAQRETSARCERLGQTVQSILTGYGMSLQRLDRAIEQHGLEPIPAVGEPFDPERMEVLEVVADSQRPSGEVVEEIRRGYLWHGKVFRFAQVKVARS